MSSKPEQKAARSSLQRAVIALATSFCLALMAGTAVAQPAWPAKPVRVVLPFAPGGVVDVSMRGLAPKMAELLGQPVVVDNRAGAGGTIGMSEVARATPDGYTLLFTLESLVLAPYLYKKPGYDPVRDYAPVSYLFTVPTTVMVSTSLPVNSLAELIALARSQPGKIASGSGGTGTISHLLLEMIKIAGNVDIQHIPYKGMAIAMTDFMAGQIQMIPASTTAAAAQVKSGKARVIAVASPKRAAMMPDVPTTHELGYPGMDALLWMGLLAPAGTPANIVMTLNSAAIRASNDPANAARYASQGIELVGSSPAEFQRFIASESSRLGKVIAAAKIQPE